MLYSSIFSQSVFSLILHIPTVQYILCEIQRFLQWARINNSVGILFSEVWYYQMGFLKLPWLEQLMMVQVVKYSSFFGLMKGAGVFKLLIIITISFLSSLIVIEKFSCALRIVHPKVGSWYVIWFMISTNYLASLVVPRMFEFTVKLSFGLWPTAMVAPIWTCLVKLIQWLKLGHSLILFGIVTAPNWTCTRGICLREISCTQVIVTASTWHVEDHRFDSRPWCQTFSVHLGSGSPILYDTCWSNFIP